MTPAIVEQLSACKVLPVLTAHSVESTLQLAQVLHRGGINAVEITLRTADALDSISAVKQAFPDMLVAAGTVISSRHMEQAILAGADLCISPGISESLLVAARQQHVQLLPGVATASEVMLGLSYNYQCFKLFPAACIDGINLLKSFSGPFPGIQFCPTGGLTPDNFHDFLGLPNVFCCAGSWMVTEKLVLQGAWDTIEALVREALV